jgi:hypothetical protein
VHLDDYPEYVADTCAYRYDAWDRLSLDVVARHDALLAMEPERLEREIDADSDDLERWAAARALRRAGERPRFLELGVELVCGDGAPHPALSYDELALYLTRELLRDRDFERGDRLLSRLAEILSEDNLDRRRLVILRDLLERSAELEGEAPEDLGDRLEPIAEEPELLYELAEDLLEVECHSCGREVLARARERAEELGRRDLLVDIELLDQDAE